MKTGHASVSVEETGKEDRVLKSVDFDPYPALYTPGLHAHARVDLGVSKGFDYGNLRVTARCVLECDQKKEVLERAGLLAFEMAREFAMDGFELLMVESKGDST